MQTPLGMIFAFFGGLRLFRQTYWETTMPIDANALAAISAVLKAGIRTWSPDISVQEVQCLVAGQTLYISGNMNELAELQKLFDGFAQAFKEDCFTWAGLEKCLWLTYVLILCNTANVDQYSGLWKVAQQRGIKEAQTPDQSEKKAKKAKHFEKEEFDALALVKGVPFKRWNDVKDLNTLEDIIKNKKHANFVGKFVKFDQEKKSKPISKSSSKDPIADIPVGTALSDVTTVKFEKGGSKSCVHAELRLLRMVAIAAINNVPGFTSADIYLGGLKPACGPCKAWIACFEGIFAKIKLKQAKHTGSFTNYNASNRPLTDDVITNYCTTLGTVAEQKRLTWLFDGGIATKEVP